MPGAGRSGSGKVWTARGLLEGVIAPLAALTGSGVLDGHQGRSRLNEARAILQALARDDA